MESTINVNNVLSTDERISFLGKVYGTLSAGILVGAIGSWMSIGMIFPSEHPWIMLFLVIGSIFLAQAMSKIKIANLLCFGLFTYLTGMSMSPIIGTLASVDPGLIVQAFLTTSIIFISLTGYVFYSKKSFTYLGGFLFIALISLIFIGLSNALFFESTILSTVLSYIGVLLFSGYILFDTSNVLENHKNDEYISGAISLYLDFFLLFSNILSLGSSND